MEQNQQAYQENQDYQQIPVKKNAKYYRARAREVLRGKWVQSAVSLFLYELIVSAVMIVAIIPMYGLIIAGALASSSSLGDFMKTPSISGGIEGFVLGGLGIMFAVMLLGTILVTPPLMTGVYRFHLNIVDGKEPGFGEMFRPFKKGYLKTIGCFLHQGLRMIPAFLVIFVSLFLGIIVGTMLESLEVMLYAEVGIAIFLIGYVIGIGMVIVQTYRYIMAFFILAEFPEMRAIDAIRNSRALMKGNKMRLFCLQLSYIGWFLLLIPATILTCGIGGMIGTYVLSGYMTTGMAAFYDDIANRAAARETEFPSLDPEDYDPNAQPW